jgi:oligopeptidase B
MHNSESKDTMMNSATAYLTARQLGAPQTPPRATIKSTERLVHGVTLRDDYAWLKDPGYPKVESTEILDHLRVENVYYETAMQRLGPTSDFLYSEMKGRIKDEDTSVPYRDGEWLYRSQFDSGAAYRVWQRKSPKDSEWKTFLNEVALADGSTTFRLGGWAINSTGNFLAWSSDKAGAERFALYVKDLNAPENASLIAENAIGCPVWAEDANTLLYLELNEHWRPYRVRAHKIGSDKPDPIIYEETDGSFFLGIGKTQSRAYIVISAGDHVTNEIRLLPADAPYSQPILISERKKGCKYSVDHAGNNLFILTNDTHENFHVAVAPITSPRSENWEEFIPGSKKCFLRNIVTFAEFMVIEERNEGLDQIRIKSYSGDEHYIKFPEPAYAVTLGDNAEFNTAFVRLVYESMVTPNTIFDYDISSHQLRVRKVYEVPTGYNPSEYITERQMAIARDGARIPISIVYRKDFKKDGSGRLHIHGYGAYGKGAAPTFSTNVLSLLDRGFAYAIAHVRGGDEMGFHWYEGGKLFNRINTFHDFIDATNHLIRGRFAARGSVSAFGRSAGGQLMGAIANLDPGLWRAIVTDVPFVDALNTMMDTSLPLTPHEWPEWGNPITDPKAFLYILNYCPYQNIKPQNYPPMRVTAGLYDPRVTYWEPAKWIAKLRALKTDENVLLFKTEMTAGHRGKAGRFDSLRETAEAYAFILHAFGVAPIDDERSPTQAALQQGSV